MCVCLQRQTGRCVSNRLFKPGMLILRDQQLEARHREYSARRLLRLELPGTEDQEGVVDIERCSHLYQWEETDQLIQIHSKVLIFRIALLTLCSSIADYLYQYSTTSADLQKNTAISTQLTLSRESHSQYSDLNSDLVAPFAQWRLQKAEREEWTAGGGCCHWAWRGLWHYKGPKYLPNSLCKTLPESEVQLTHFCHSSLAGWRCI